VQPGDVILVHAGVYKDQRFRYGGGLGTLFDVTAADHIHFEGITFRNTEVAILAGRKRIIGSSGLVVRHSRFEDVGIGITSDWSGSKDFYIADNVFVGRQIPDHLMGWIGRTWQSFPDFPVELRSNVALKVYGSGHVVAYNDISHFHDGVDHATYGTEIARMAHAIGMKVIATDPVNRNPPGFVSYVGQPEELASLVGQADVVMVAALNWAWQAPLGRDHPLWDAPNLILAPWAGAPVAVAADASPGRMSENELRWLVVRENMRRFATGERMFSVFDVQRGF
jgi:hypothetical protein